MALVVTVVLPRLVAPVVPFEHFGNDAIRSSFILIGYNLLKHAPLIPAWSLDLELQFYLIAPVMFAMTVRRPILLLITTTIIGYFGLLLWSDRTLLPFLPFFAIGMVFANSHNIVTARWVSTISAIATAAIFVILIIDPTLRPMIYKGAHLAPIFSYNPHVNVALALLAMPFALQTVFRRSNKIDKLLSDASFSLYLFHWIPFLLLGHYFPSINQQALAERALLTSLILIATVVLSLIITVGVDRPINRFREKFVRGREQSARFNLPKSDTLATDPPRGESSRALAP